MQTPITAGTLEKMHITVDDAGLADYRFVVDKTPVLHLNPLIGKPVTLTFEGKIHCVACGDETPKSYRQGYCKPCSVSLQEAADCRIRPELCDHDTGSCAEPHIVYLSHTGQPKVGITKHHDEGEVSTRWLDQGATSALPILKVKNRRLVGLTECLFKPFISDRTNWRAMLQDVPHDETLPRLKEELKAQVQPQIDALNDEYGEGAVRWLDEQDVCHIHYPVSRYPTSIASHNLDTTPTLKGVLHGIKGQYLFVGDKVINLRKYTGYQIRFSQD